MNIPECRWRDDAKTTCSSTKIAGRRRRCSDTPCPIDPKQVCPICRFANHEAVKDAPQRRQGGPGTELSAMLSWWGIAADASCSCKQRANLMDAYGADWCAAKLETIVGWLKEEAERRGLPFVAWLARGMVRKAIKRAKAKAAA
jgi:hypothetical protein